ncbi:MAG: hypothetical protein ACTSQ4_01350 [Candidatus Heimdallarchaeaceae archaeon]
MFQPNKNEIVKSKALTGKAFARYWFQNGYINTNKEETSNS